MDIAFNVSLVVFGVDFFGRPSALRPGDFIPRLHGAFGNPMATVAIAVTAIFIGLILQKRWLTTFGVIAVLINGTMRAPLTIILIASFWILLIIERRPLPRVGEIWRNKSSRSNSLSISVASKSAGVRLFSATRIIAASPRTMMASESINRRSLPLSMS